jgi:hypothetical protein
MAETKADGLEQLVIQQIERFGLTLIAFVSFLICALIAGIFWWLGRKQTLMGGALDNRKKKNDLLAALTTSRNKFRSNEESLNLCLKTTKGGHRSF